MFRGTPIQYEPLKKNRFYMEFPSELGIESWLVMTSKRPSITVNPIEIPYFDQATYVSGKVRFGAIDITLISHIAPSSGQKVMEWLRLHHEILTGRSGYAIGYKKTLSLKDADPTGIEVAKFTLFDCMVTSVDFGTNDYNDDGVQMVSFTVQPDRVEMPY
jgi:hypothetical protein